MDQRIVACAREWVGTRFHHQGRLKKSAEHKGGVDCLGLLMGVARELEISGAKGTPLCDVDETDYPHYPDTKRLRESLDAFLYPIALQSLAPGDVVLFNIDDNPQHLAIASNMKDSMGIIHAYAPAKAVVEHQLDAWWKACIEAVYRIPASSN